MNVVNKLDSNLFYNRLRTKTVYRHKDCVSCWLNWHFCQLSPERRWSIHSFRYGCLVTTLPWLLTLPSSLKKEPSGTANFRGMTGGEYKTWERIQRAVADARLLAIPTSCRRVAACNLNWDRFFGISSTSRFGNPLYRPLYHACRPRRKSHADLTSSPPSSGLRRQSAVYI